MLHDTDRAGREGSRTRVAIQPREAHLLQGSVVDLFCRSYGEVTVGEDESKKRDDRGSYFAKDCVGLSGLFAFHILLGLPDPNAIESERRGLDSYERQLTGNDTDNERGCEQQGKRCSKSLRMPDRRR